MSLLLRATKGSPLTIAEMDANLTFLGLLGFRVFSGLSNGCKPNDSSYDNAQAISDTIALAATVGGIAFFPAGIYYLTSAPAGAANCQIQLPYVPFSDSSGNRIPSKTVTIAGEGMIPWLDTGLPEYPSAVPVCGTIFYSTATGTGTFPSVFGTIGQSTAYGQYTNLDVKFQNCTVRVKANNSSGGTGPTMCGINMQWAATSSFEQVRADVDARGPDTVEPQREVFGIRLTKTNGQTNVVCRDTLVVGFKYGYVCGEHTKGFNVQAFCCTHGATFTKTNHGAALYGFLAQWCRYNISAGMIDAGPCTVEVGSASFEYKSSGQWFDSVASVYDAQNLLYGNMKFIVVSSDSGKDNSKFTKMGGANFFCYPTGYNYATAAAGATGSSGGTLYSYTATLNPGPATDAPAAALPAGADAIYGNNFDPKTGFTLQSEGVGWAVDSDTASYSGGVGQYAPGSTGAKNTDDYRNGYSFVPRGRYVDVYQPTKPGFATLSVRVGPTLVNGSLVVSGPENRASYNFLTIDLGPNWQAEIVNAGYVVKICNSSGDAKKYMVLPAVVFRNS